MKTRMGFVSNSSSSSFVIALSRNFEITDKVIKNFMKEHDEFRDETEKKMTKKEAEKRIKDVIEFACKKSYLSSYDEDEDSYDDSVYENDDDNDEEDEDSDYDDNEEEPISKMEDLNTLIEAVPELVIGTIEGGPDDSGDQCINVLADDTIAKVKSMIGKGK